MSLLGRRALRLMRENWQSPRALAEELYAIFTARDPIELEDTLTIRVPEGRPAIRVARREERPDDRPAPATQPPPRRERPGPTDTGVGYRTNNRVQDDGPGRRARPQEDALDRFQRPGESPRDFVDRTNRARRGVPDPGSRAPLIEVDGPVAFGGSEPVRFSTPPVFTHPETGRETTIEQMVEESVASRLALLGFARTHLIAARITAPTLNARDYYAEIYEDGLDKPPILDQSGMPAPQPLRIIYIHPEARLLPGTIVFPVVKVAEFYMGQVPVWLG